MKWCWAAVPLPQILVEDDINCRAFRDEMQWALVSLLATIFRHNDNDLSKNLIIW